jgi:outer membrane biosynthesis protein TonB
MIPQTQPRKKKNSSKVNLAISFVVHAAIVAVLFYFAAREGFLGKQLQKISVQMIKEKPPEKPPEKPKIEPPKLAEPPKQEPPKMAEAPKPEAAPTAAPPVVAPANTELPSFDFGGGHEVDTTSDPVQLYKGYMEFALRQQWNRPEDMNDDNYVAEVAVNVDKKGDLSNPVWLKGSGNPVWDASVKAVFDVVKVIDRPPPTNFPPHVTIRFDVQTEAEPELQ